MKINSFFIARMNQVKNQYIQIRSSWSKEHFFIQKFFSSFFHVGIQEQVWYENWRESRYEKTVEWKSKRL